MFEIKGKYGVAQCYATNIEQSAVDQIQAMTDMVFAEGQNIAIMPDAHTGAGCTIGTTMTVTDKICPNLVGVDISCFVGDTVIPRSDGQPDVKLKDIVNQEVWIYAMDVSNKRIIPAKALCRLTKQSASLVKVVLDSGQSIICTPDHQFMMQDGMSYREAQKLKSGQSLRSFVRSYNPDGYLCVNQPYNSNPNHKVVSVETLPYTEDVYCLAVPEYHNFAISAGVFVHNCGMLTVDLGVDHIDFEKLDEACYYVPSGRNVWDGKKANFELTNLACYRYLNDVKRIKRSIGTLGGGNHFIEVDKAENGRLYLVIHSGSRNLGKQVAEYYQKIAVQLHSGYEDHFKQRQTIIDTYKAEGRRSEIQEALKELNRNFKQHSCEVPKELAFLYGQWFDDYIGDVAIIHQFAKLNRETMAEVICNYLGIDPVSMFHTTHNYIDTDEMILRKGAISAKEGELVLIPLNMRDGSVLAYGKGNESWNQSGPHGAGRVMSRTQARKDLSLDDYKKQMVDVYTTSVCEKTIDEAPDAYKPKEDILGPIGESVDIIEVLKPIYNFKAAD